MGVSESDKILQRLAAGKRKPRVIVIGTGLSGICMGMRLMAAGYDDLVLLEQADRCGGTWHYNQYPGLRCDVPSHYYQYSFEPSAEWSQRFCGGAEIREYFEAMARKYHVFERIRFNTASKHAEWTGSEWRVDIETADGGREQLRCDILIASCGILVRPNYPDIPGLDSFAGEVIHSARWDHSVDLTGKRVGVIGNGSTGIQMIKPLTDICAKVVSFQRTPQWVLPIPNRKYGDRGRNLARRFPIISKFYYVAFRFAMEQLMGRGIIKDGWSRRMVGKFCKQNLETVADPVLRAKLTPDYTPMCKRLVMSSDFYPAIQRPNAELERAAIDHVEPKGIVTKEGKLHELDVIALATGYHANEYMLPMTMTGENGVTLDEVWKNGPRGYRTVALPGFPNFFMVMGPHSPVGNFSLASIAETQSAYIMRFIDMWAERKFEKVSPREDATDRFNAEMLANMKNTVWTTGCKSWYLDDKGVPGSWPWTATRFRGDLQDPRLQEYVIS
ncbi:MAG TPA: NAD(P)/FAD-dependent oxidoreductase [Porticoccaceae bacterium]|nr:NAD(P)/FAD-dependent oxidoreductase [Porticoccaceae bacterium]